MQEIAFKFEVSSRRKYSFKASTCGGLRARISINKAQPKPCWWILNVYLFSCIFFLLTKLVFFVQNIGQFEVSRVGKSILKASTCGGFRDRISINKAQPQPGYWTLNVYLFSFMFYLLTKLVFFAQNTKYRPV